MSTNEDQMNQPVPEDTSVKHWVGNISWPITLSKERAKANRQHEGIILMRIAKELEVTDIKLRVKIVNDSKQGPNDLKPIIEKREMIQLYGTFKSERHIAAFKICASVVFDIRVKDKEVFSKANCDHIDTLLALDKI